MTALIEFYSSIECPFAYTTIYRLRQVWPEFAGRVQIIWRALSLEYVNERAPVKPTIKAELDFLTRLEPGLPVQPWQRPDWQWPATMWPAFEALACAQAQNSEAAFAMSWALRRGFFAESCCLSLRHELLDIAQAVAGEAPLDLAQFEKDWDSGRYKATVIAESRRGWYELKLNGSATLVLPDGRRLTNPGMGEVDFDEDNNVLRRHTPYPGDPLQAFRDLLSSVN